MKPIFSLSVLHRCAPLALAIACAGASASARAQSPETGLASIYGSDLQGRLTASGQPYDGDRLTAAHRTLPIGTQVRVVNPANGRSVSVVINDRWGGGPGRVINLSRRAAGELGMGSAQQVSVRLEVESLGTGRTEQAAAAPGASSGPGNPGEWTRPTGKPEREKVPDRIEVSASDLAGRTARCRNEADILGLKDAWHESHVQNCLARKAPKAGSAAR